MNENETNAFVDTEFDVDLSDLFDESESGDHTEEQTEETTQAEENPGAEVSAPAAQEQGEPAKPDDGIEVKYLGETKKISRADAPALIQKGFNHDRILEQRNQLQTERDELAKFRDENSGLLEMLNTLAQNGNTTPQAVLAALRENLLVSQGNSRETAREIIRREDAERDLKKTNAAKAQEAERQKADAQMQEFQKQAREKDVQAFIRLYGKIDAKDIPEEVWKDANENGSLVAAYGRYENRKLQAQIQELQQKLNIQNKNEENKKKTVGSMKSDGTDDKDDKFLAGFMSG